MGILRTLLGVGQTTRALKAVTPAAAAPTGESGDRASGSPVKEILDGIDGLLGVERIRLLTYREAFRYFVASRPDDSRIVRGALMCRPAGFGDSLVIWMFLDATNSPVEGTGRKAIVAALDDELAECFDRRDMLIIE